MEKVRLDDVDSRMGPSAVRRPLSDALGTTDVAINYFELAPGDSFAFGFHAHADQEEVFSVQEGTVTFETEDEPVEVSAGELIRFAPGEHQRGVNRGDDRVVALALGAPKDTGETEILRECDSCGERTPQSIEMADDREALLTRCASCESETGRFT